MSKDPSVFLVRQSSVRVLCAGLTCLLVSCSPNDGSVESVSWQGDLPLVYNQATELQVILRPGEVGAIGMDAMLDASSNLDPTGKIREVLDDGRVAIRFSVVPLAAGNDLEATIRFGRNANSRHRIQFDVEMPLFAGRSNGSFLELIDAPDSSVYGAHITIWEGVSSLIVSGHAASNICRQITAAVMNFAKSHSPINDDFFVGAGFASLPIDENAQDEALTELTELLAAASLEDATLALLIGGAQDVYDLAEVVEDPASYRPRSAEAIRFQRVLDSVIFSTDTNVDAVIEWVNRPYDAVALMRSATATPFEGVVDQIRVLSVDQRSNLANALRKYAALLDSKELVYRTIGEVESRSGFIRQRDTSSPESGAILSAVQEWEDAAAPGSAAALSDIFPSASSGDFLEAEALENLSSFFDQFGPSEGEFELDFFRSGEMAQSDIGAVAFLPFRRASDDVELVFDVPKELFDSATPSRQGASILENLGNSVVHELVSNLEDAANRQDANYRTVVAQELPDFQREMLAQSDTTEWLQELRVVTFQDVDERGRRTGEIRVERIPNVQYWVRRLEYAEDTRRLASLFRQSAERIQEEANDPKNVAINQYALLDSFLRGWDLAFLDNANESPYRNWLAQSRTQVWEEIFRQARQQGLDISPIVSEQTVFQVRDNGDSFRIRPMYVGDVAETEVVKSLDGRLVYFQSPWMGRQVTFLRAEDVGDETWSTAATLFAPGAGNPGLESLAESILSTALSSTEYTEQRAGTLRALAVSPQYVSSRLTAELWNLWEVDAATIAEERQFEQLLANLERSEEEFMRVLRVTSPEDERFQRFLAYLRVRASEGVLRTMRCISEVTGRLEAGESDQQSTAREFQACFETLSVAEVNVLRAMNLYENFSAARENVLTNSVGWDFDALGRIMAIGDLTEAMADLAQFVAPIADGDIRMQTKRATEAQIRLIWYSGNFRQALQATIAAVREHSSSEVVSLRTPLLEDLELEILKALVYAGGSLASVSEPELRVAANGENGRHSDFFAVRASDVVLEPQSINEIVSSLDEPVGNPASTNGARQLFSSITDARRMDVSVATGGPAGMITTRSPSGLLSVIWPEGGSAAPIALSEAVDESEQSISTKLSSTVPVLTADLIQALREGGLQLLEGKDLNAQFDHAFLLVFPGLRQVFALTEDKALRFVASDNGGDLREVVERALSAKGIAVNHVVDELGLSNELEEILTNQIDPAVYFSRQPFPGVVAYSQDGASLQVLLQDSGDILHSVSFENGRLLETALGREAIADLTRFEQLALANRSDDEVRFMHVAAIDRSIDSMAQIQLGRAGANVPITELDALIAGTKQQTPSMDSLFPTPPEGVRPTVIVYRDAFVRGRFGSGGGYKPPISSEVTPFGWDPDRRPMQGTYQMGLEHVAPLNLLLALKRKYPEYRFLLDDALDIARANALDPITVGSAADVAAYLPPSSFRVTHLGAVANIASSLLDSGVVVEDSMTTLPRPNVLVISGHKDQALEQYVEAHIAEGNFRGKLVVLFSCYQAGDANLSHRVIAEGGAREVLYFAEVISPASVNLVMIEFARILEEIGAAPDSRLTVLELINASIDATLQRDDIPSYSKDEIGRLRESVPQVSHNDASSDMDIPLAA